MFVFRGWAEAAECVKRPLHQNTPVCVEPLGGRGAGESSVQPDRCGVYVPECSRPGVCVVCRSKL